MLASTYYRPGAPSLTATHGSRGDCSPKSWNPRMDAAPRLNSTARSGGRGGGGEGLGPRLRTGANLFRGFSSGRPLFSFCPGFLADSEPGCWDFLANFFPYSGQRTGLLP